MAPRVIHTAQALVDVVVEVPDLPRRGGNSMATSVARYAGGATTILLAAVRSGDRTTRTRSERTLSASTPADVIALLREAVETRGELVIGYVGNDGTVAERVVTAVMRWTAKVRSASLRSSYSSLVRRPSA